MEKNYAFILLKSKFMENITCRRHVSVSTGSTGIKLWYYFVLQIGKKKTSKNMTEHYVTISKLITQNHIFSLIQSNGLVYQIDSSAPYVILNCTKHSDIFGETCFCLKMMVMHPTSYTFIFYFTYLQACNFPSVFCVVISFLDKGKLSSLDINSNTLK